MKRKLIVMFGIVCSMGLLACNSTESSVAEAGGTKAESVAESVTPAGPIDVKDYYSVTQTESGEMVYSFDTSVFEQERFDDKWTFDTIEVPLPLGSVREMQELGVDIGTSLVAESKKDLYVNKDSYSERIIAPGESGSLETFWGFLPEGDYLDTFISGNIYLINNTETEIGYLDADIDQFIVPIYGDEDAAKLAGVLGIECDSEEVLNMDKIVECLGIPAFYWKAGNLTELDLYYFYGDYSLVFTFRGYGDAYGTLKEMRYVSQDQLDYAVSAEATEWVEYNKACEAYR